MTKTKPTKEQFKEYVVIRNSGVVNMMDIPYITAISDTVLDKSTCLYIMDHFSELVKEYEVEI